MSNLVEINLDGWGSYYLEKKVYDNLKNSYWAFCRYSATDLTDATFDSFLAGYLSCQDSTNRSVVNFRYSHKDLII